ncbi:MAG TPA: triose-phosphate isomerase [Chloroflexota bacterium]
MSASHPPTPNPSGNGSTSGATENHAPRRRKVVGGNWKMNTTLEGAIALAEDLARRLGDTLDVDVVLFPPFPNLEAVHRVIEATTLQLGAQNVFWEDSGAYTGEVSAPMLEAVGCDWVIVGHSERRRIMGESSEIVNRKLRAVLHHGLRGILAVGETREERHAHRTETVVREQLEQSLERIDAQAMGRVVIAYEPVWAIGTGETATPDQARDAHAFVRRVLAELFGDTVATATIIQYGGSVTAANCAELMAEPGIDGALVGGASLKPDEFTAIVRAAES